MDNIKKLQKAEIKENRIGKGKDPTAVHKFGFPAVTCCGYIGQNNEWCDDWVVSDDILMYKLQPRKWNNPEKGKVTKSGNTAVLNWISPPCHHHHHHHHHYHYHHHRHHLSFPFLYLRGTLWLMHHTFLLANRLISRLPDSISSSFIKILCKAF